MPAGKSGEQIRARTERAPAAHRPTIAHDGDDVDLAAGLHRVMHQVGIGAEPQKRRRAAERRRDALGVDQRPPGGAVAEAGRPSVAELGPHGGPQPVGADEGDAVLFDRAGATARHDRDAVAVDRVILDPPA